MDARLDASPGQTNLSQESSDEHKTPTAHHRSFSEGSFHSLTIRVHKPSESSLTPEATPTKTPPVNSAMAFVYPATKETESGISAARQKPPKPAAAKTQHFGYSDEDILGWVFCSGTHEAIELRQDLGQQFRQLGEKLTEQITRDIPFFTEQVRQNPECTFPTEIATAKKKSSLSGSHKMATSLLNILDADSEFKPEKTGQSLKSQLQTAIAGDQASPVDKTYSEHLLSMAVATIRTRLGKDRKALPRLPPEAPFAVDGFQGEYCVPVTVDYSHNGSKKLKTEKRKQFFRNEGIGLCVAKQLNPESRDARSDRKSFMNDMYRSNLTIQVQLGDRTYLPVYNTAIHRGQLEVQGSEEFAASDTEVAGVSSEAMNSEITDTVSQVANKLAPGSEKVVESLAHQGLGNEMFMATNAVLQLYLQNSQGSTEGANIFVTYIDQSTVRVDVACAYDQSITYQHSVVSKEKVDVETVTSVLVKRQESEDGLETLWVPVSANVKVDADTKAHKLKKKSRASAGSTASLSSTKEQEDYGKTSPRSLITAMTNLKQATSGAMYQAGITTEETTSGFQPPFERSISQQPQSHLQVKPTHQRQNSGPVFTSSSQSTETQRKMSIPNLLTPIGQSQIYSSGGGGSAATSTTSTTSVSARSTDSSTRSLSEDSKEGSVSPPMSLSPQVESTDRVKLPDTSVCFEHKGQWYMSSFGADEFTRREQRVEQYEQYFARRLQECVKPPARNNLGGRQSEVVRLGFQLNKLSDNYPRANLFADAKMATLKGRVQVFSTETSTDSTETSAEEARKHMSGRGFDEVESRFAHQYQKHAAACLDEVAAYSTKMGLPASVARLTEDQVKALNSYLEAIDTSSKNLMEQADEIDEIHESRPQTEKEYRTFLKALEDIKARTNKETDKVRWRTQFVSKHQGSLMEVEKNDISGQQEPLLTELYKAITLEPVNNPELIKYLDIKKQELLLVKQLCTFKTLKALVDSRPGNPGLVEALHYDKCTQLIHGTDGSTREEIGVSELLDADPSQVDITSVFKQMDARLVEVKPLETAVPMMSMSDPETVVLEQKHLELQASIRETLTENLKLTAEDLEDLGNLVEMDFSGSLGLEAEDVNISSLAKTLNLLLTTTHEGYEDVKAVMDYILLQKSLATVAALMEETTDI